MKRLLQFTAVMVAVGLPGACLPGPEGLLKEANLEVVVTGLNDSDIVAIDVDAAAFSREATDAAVRFFVTVSPGPHAGVVVIDRGTTSLCAAFSVLVPNDGRVTVGVDSGVAVGCDPAVAVTRTFVSIEETVVGDCGNPSCTTTTTVDANGEVEVDSGAEPSVRGQGRPDDKSLLIKDTLSADADALFTDGVCEPRPGQVRETVELTRTTEVDGDIVTETIDISNCRSGIASRLRAHLALLRADVAP